MKCRVSRPGGHVGIGQGNQPGDPGPDKHGQYQQDPVAEQASESASGVPTRPAGQESDQPGDGNEGYENLEKRGKYEDSHYRPSLLSSIGSEHPYHGHS